MTCTNSQLLSCLDVISLCNAAETRADVERIWKEMTGLCGIEGLLLNVSEIPSDFNVVNHTTLDFGIPKAWLESYFSKDYVYIDPVVKMAYQSDDVFTWENAFEEFGANVPEFIEEATQFGLTHGFAIAQEHHKINGLASLCSVSVKPDISDCQKQLIHRILPHLMDVISRPGFLEIPTLTPQQIAVLSYAAKNLSNKEIAACMGFTVSATKFHLTQIYKKLKVNSKPDAVKKATIAGVIKFFD